MPPQVDVVLVFHAFPKSTPGTTTGATTSKQQLRQNAAKAERQYTALMDTLTRAGLNAVGRRGENQDQLLVLVRCPREVLVRLVRCERHSDFLYGLPMSSLPTSDTDLDSAPLSPADRIRLVHAYITSTPQDGGLGIIPGCKEWDLVQSAMVLHDHAFNEQWIRLWTRHRIASVQLEKVRDEFGDSVALYFCFLTAYTRALLFPAALGVLFYFFHTPYSTLYSSLLLLWSIVFVEWWRLQERILSVRWHTRGSFRVEKRRADYDPSVAWWTKEMRKMASVPVILGFASVLAAVLTGIFVLEAFVTQLYTGPGHRLVAFSPTIVFMALVPKLLDIYKTYAKRFTDWENHAHQSNHISSLTIKVFALSAMNAYLGLALSAFVYVPFGESVMHFVQYHLFHGGHHAATILGRLNLNLNETIKFGSGGGRGEKIVSNVTTPKVAAGSLFEADVANARRKLNPSRLQEQMFAFTVTNQVVDNFMEIGLPYVLRAIESFRSGRGFRGGNGKGSVGGKKKRVAFEDESIGQGQEGRGKEEREFLETVRREVALPEYDVFGDYSEMVTQFGYVALWSTIWPLAPVMALLNNYIEARSDAFKMTVHTRRPIPVRTDTIGAWLESLSFLTWLSALTNSALVYLFRPPEQVRGEMGGLGEADGIDGQPGHHVRNGIVATKELLVSALLIALVASHVYLLLRAAVRRVLELAIWRRSEEKKEGERVEREVKEKYLQQCRVSAGEGGEDQLRPRSIIQEKDEWAPFWAADEGLEEIRKSVKDA